MRIEGMAALLGCAALFTSAACGDDAGGDTTATSGNGGTGATGGSSTTSAGGMATTSSGMGGDGTGGSPIPGYPAGPYGNQEGNTFPQLSFEGYLSTDAAALATTEMWTETYTSTDLYESGASYALVHTSLSG